MSAKEWCDYCQEYHVGGNSHLLEADAHSLQRHCSAATWKMLALRMADEAMTCLNNSHWEVKFGSGDLLNTIRAVQSLKERESKEPPNNCSTKPSSRTVN